MRVFTFFKKRIFTLVLACMALTSVKAQTNVSAPFCPGIFSSTPCNQPAFSNFPSNTVNDFIDSFVTTGATTNIVNVNTGCNGLANNYIFYCTPVMVVIPGQVITCSVQSGINFNQSFAIFIDWNQNNNFEVPSERMDASSSPPPAASWYVMTFTVPLNQPQGQYRLRLRCYNTPSNTYVDPCGPATVGETEDYRLYVGNGGPPPLSASLNNNSPLCTGQTLSFIMIQNGSGASTFSWSGPGGFSTNLQNPILSGVTPSAAGVYTVNITDGPCSVSKTISVNVNLTPTISINSTSVCAGEAATLVATGANSYTWSSGQTTPSIVITPVSNATFMATGNSGGCVSSQTAAISVTPVPSVNITGSNTLICIGSSATISAIGAGSYSWSTGAGSSSIVVTPAVITNYSVTGFNGPCTGTAGYTQNVEDCSPTPTVGIKTFGNDRVQVYPNPFNNSLTIMAPVPVKASLYNTLGQILLSQTVNGSAVLTTTDLPAGIYFVRIEGPAGRKTLKLIKN